MTASQTSLFLITLAVFRYTGLCRMPLSWNFSNVFLMTKLELWDFGRKITEVKCLYIVLRVQTLNMSYHCWCCLWSRGWGTVCQVSPLWSSSFFLLFHTLWKKVTWHSPHFRSVELCFTFLKAKYLHNNLEFFCIGCLSVLLHLFIYSVMYLYQC